MRTTLINFVNSGGVLIHAHHNHGGGVNAGTTLITGILGAGITPSTSLGIRHATFSGSFGDSLVYNTGYFDLTGDKKIGYDGAENATYTFTPQQQAEIDVLAVGGSSNAASIFKSKKLGYLVIGDGAPWNGGVYAFAYNSVDFRPLYVSPDDLPLPKKYGQYDNAYNAHFFVNAMIWAIQRRLATNP
jgi:hypothetical protein